MYEGPAYRCRRRSSARSLPALRHALAGRGLKIAHNAELRQKFNDHKSGFPVGSLLTFAAFTSVSLDDKVADGFGDHVLFNFTRVRGVRIRALSAVPQEAEVWYYLNRISVCNLNDRCSCRRPPSSAS